MKAYKKKSDIDLIIIPMTKEELRKYEIEANEDFWLWPDIQDDKLEMLYALETYSCKTDNSPIKKYLVVRWIIQNCQSVVVDGVLLDLFSASIIYQVAQHLMKEKKRDTFIKLFNCKIEKIAWVTRKFA